MNAPEPIIQEIASESETVKSSFRRRAIIVSVIVHLTLVLVLLFWYLPEPDRASSSKSMASQSSSTSSDSSRKPKLPPPAPVVEIPPEQIEKSLQSQIDQVKNLPDEQKLSELEKNLKRLQSIASEESVQQVSSTIASTLGLDQDQYAPKDEPSEGMFDTESGQLQDVRRTRDQSGAWKYESVLVDAEGRTMTVPLTPAEGETLHSTFEKMKKFPMAEGIYRGLVMPLIQKMLEAEKVAQRAAIQAEQMQQQDRAAPTTQQRTD